MSEQTQRAPTPSAAPPALHVLVVEDDPVDASLVRAVLDSADRAVIESTVTTTFRDALEHLESGQFDVVLLDLGLPDSDGLATLAKIADASPDTPVVVLSGVDDPSLERETIISGAQDFLSKQVLTGDHALVARTVARSLVASVDRHAIARLARAGEKNLRRVVEEHPECIVVLDREGCVLLANRAATHRLGDGGDLRGRALVAGPLDDHDELVTTSTVGDGTLELRLNRSTWYGRPAWLAAIA